MIFVRRTTLVLCMGLCATGGCVFKPQSSPTARGESAIVISTGETRTRHTAEGGNRIVITLPSIERPNHGWQIASHDTRFLQQLTSFSTPDTARADAKGVMISFLALRAGMTRLQFVLLPMQSSREASVAAQHEVVLTLE